MRKTLEQNGVLDDQPAAPGMELEEVVADGTSWPDYWSPAFQVPVEDVEFEDDYGAISPIPNHDGTECFKWDNTMWAAADHFKVSRLRLYSIPCCHTSSVTKLPNKVTATPRMSLFACSLLRDAAVSVLPLQSKGITRPLTKTYDHYTCSTAGTYSRTYDQPSTRTRVALRSSLKVCAIAIAAYTRAAVSCQHHIHTSPRCDGTHTASCTKMQLRLAASSPDNKSNCRNEQVCLSLCCIKASAQHFSPPQQHPSLLHACGHAAAASRCRRALTTTADLVQPGRLQHTTYP